MKDFSTIALAEIRDAAEIGQLFRAATVAMQARGIDQWNATYPLEKEALADIKKSCLYKYMVGTSIAGVVSLNAEQEAVYSTIEWTDAGKALIVHRIAVHPDFQHRGIAKTLMAYAETLAKAENYTSIRLDTYCKNDYSLRLYAQLGYEQKAGRIHFEGRKFHFYCFEKVLISH